MDENATRVRGEVFCFRRARVEEPKLRGGQKVLSAVERPQLCLNWLTISVLSLELSQGCATTPVEPVVSPGEPSPGGCSASRLGG